ncbi:TetR/AcrR family transcriptional regulator [Streptomyces fumanus]|uniref:TetR/AcrR family transcriptional regulator n=1 Tax=Streptomyces fumanus TaxID=67302 RepID=UPI0033FD44F0
MSRWQPDAKGRLAKAALELYCERGYEQTTVAEIAGRAGLTERTFFRHYADKREVLFDGTAALQELFTSAVAAAPEEAAPIEAVAAGLEAVCASFAGRTEFARRRHFVIAATAELRERELIKLATLASALAGTLRQRGVPEPAAGLTAEAGVAVFRIGFERWVAPGEDRELAQVVRECLAGLRTAVGAA